MNLAIENQNSLLIIDDMQARKLARQLGLAYTGTIGVLLRAKQTGYVKSIRQILLKIRSTNFHLSEEIEQKALKLSGENEASDEKN